MGGAKEGPQRWWKAVGPVLLNTGVGQKQVSARSGHEKARCSDPGIFIFKLYNLFACPCVCMPECGQLRRIGSRLLSRRCQALSSGRQAWQQGPLLTEPFR